MKFLKLDVTSGRAYRYMLMCPGFRYPLEYYFDSLLTVEEYATFLQQEGYEFSLQDLGWSFTVEFVCMNHLEGKRYE